MRFLRSPSGTFPGPLWLLQLWLQAYFPDLRYDPPPSPVHDFSTYGSWLSSFPLKEVTFHGCFQIFLGLSSALLGLLPPSRFMPFQQRSVGPDWFRRLPSVPISGQARDDHSKVWGSFLVCRDLHYVKPGLLLMFVVGSSLPSLPAI